MLKCNSCLVEKLKEYNMINQKNFFEEDKLYFPFIIIEFPAFKKSNVINNMS